MRKDLKEKKIRYVCMKTNEELYVQEPELVKNIIGSLTLNADTFESRIYEINCEESS